MFTARMQAIFRALVAHAWAVTVKRQSWSFPDKKTGTAAKDAWYRSQLLNEFNVETTKDLDGDSFAKLCALFEAEIGESIYWQMRALGGRDGEKARRIIHQIREVCRTADLDENYARGIARQAVQSESTPLLEDLKPPQLLAVLQALKVHTRRMSARTA